MITTQKDREVFFDCEEWSSLKALLGIFCK